MEDALLVPGADEAVIAGGAVVGQVPLPVPADHLGQGFGATPGVDGEDGQVGADPGVQPDEVPAEAPTRLVRRQVVLLGQGRQQGLIGRLQAAAGAEDDLGAGAARQEDAQEGEHGRDLAVGQASVLVEVDDQGLGLGADLAGGRPGGARRPALRAGGSRRHRPPERCAAPR